MRTAETARLRHRNTSDSPSALRWRSFAFHTSLRDYSGQTEGNYLNKNQKPKTKNQKQKIRRTPKLRTGVGMIKRSMPQASQPKAEGESETPRGRRRARVGVIPIEPAVAAERKVDQKDSRSEATLSFPLFASLRRGPSEGGLALWGRLLLLTFLGETRKVSGCRAAPGAFSRPESDKN